jgi:hypothetical protein
MHPSLFGVIVVKDCASSKCTLASNALDVSRNAVLQSQDGP